MWRILPAYWVALAFATLLAVLPTWPLVVGGRATWWDVVANALGVQTVFTSTMGSINGSLWSVSVELLLYLTFPLLVLLVHRAGRAALVVVTLAVSVGWWWLGTVAQLGSPFEGLLGSGFTLPARAVQFALGMVLATVLVPWLAAGWSRRRATVAPVFAVGATVLATAASTADAPSPVAVALWGVAGAGLVWAFAEFGHVTALRRADRAGGRAFSFYLLHQPIVLLFAPVVMLLPLPAIAAFIVGGAMVLIVLVPMTEALYRFVERPSHRAGVRRFPRTVRTPETVPMGPAATPLL